VKDLILKYKKAPVYVPNKMIEEDDPPEKGESLIQLNEYVQHIFSKQYD